MKEMNKPQDIQKINPISFITDIRKAVVGVKPQLDVVTDMADLSLYETLKDNVINLIKSL